MRKALFLFVTVLGATVTPAQAAPEPSIVVIDSGMNTSLFKNVIAEYCVVEMFTCPNGKPQMEGIGAANIPVSTNVTLTHGTEMASVIAQVNPTANIIPIRIVGIASNGYPGLYSNNAVKSALDWVLVNVTKYNIRIVNISQGKIFANCGVPEGMAADVSQLKTLGVTVVAATGNDSNRTAMMSPACLPNVVSVGATDNPDSGTTGKTWNPTAKPYIARYSNGTAQTTYYTNARFKVLQPNGTTKFMVGTSNSAAAISAWLLTHPTPDTTTASNEWLTGRYVFIP
jgi:hypothetical protein